MENESHSTTALGGGHKTAFGGGHKTALEGNLTEILIPIGSDVAIDVVGEIATDDKSSVAITATKMNYYNIIMMLLALLTLFGVLLRYTDTACLSEGDPFTLTVSVIIFMAMVALILFTTSIKLVYWDEFIVFLKEENEDAKHAKAPGIPSSYVPISGDSPKYLLFSFINLMEMLIYTIMWIIPLGWVLNYPMECNNSVGYIVIRVVLFIYLVSFPCILFSKC